MNLTQRPLLTTDEILKIERPYLLVMCSGLSPAMTYSPDLSKWKFNEILGLGSKNWNTKVREYRENHRKVRKIKPLKLWNVAEQTKQFKKILEQKQLLEEKERRKKSINLEGKL